MTPENEDQRLAALRACQVLDSEPEPAFDRITALAARLFSVPIALVSLVDESRQWFKSRVGLDVNETPRGISFCTHAILSAEPMVVADAALDPRFRANPLVTGPPHIRFYAGAPLLNGEGLALGTVCVIDTVPRQVDHALLATLADLAALAVDELELRQNKVQLELRSRALELALEESQRNRLLFEKIAHTSPDVIYLLDLATRRNIYVNRDALAHLGYTPEQLRDFGDQLLPAILHPDDLVPVVEHFRHFDKLADDDNLEILYRTRHASGSYRWFLARENVFRRNPDGSPCEILGVATDVTELKEAEQLSSRMAVVDELTQVANKRAFRQRLHQLVLEGQRGRQFALVIADIDHFKHLNDACGHLEGDCVLRGFADRLVASVRNVDLVARFGGEEFAILLVDVDGATALLLAERLREAVTSVPSPRAVSASFGVCTFQAAPDANGDALLAAADGALYEAKRTGRNRVVAYSAAPKSLQPPSDSALDTVAQASR